MTSVLDIFTQEDRLRIFEALGTPVDELEEFSQLTEFLQETEERQERTGQPLVKLIRKCLDEIEAIQKKIDCLLLDEGGGAIGVREIDIPGEYREKVGATGGIITVENGIQVAGGSQLAALYQALADKKTRLHRYIGAFRQEGRYLYERDFWQGNSGQTILG